jgi:hypothetical protein
MRPQFAQLPPHPATGVALCPIVVGFAVAQHAVADQLAVESLAVEAEDAGGQLPL